MHHDDKRNLICKCPSLRCLTFGLPEFLNRKLLHTLHSQVRELKVSFLWRPLDNATSKPPQKPQIPEIAGEKQTFTPLNSLCAVSSNFNESHTFYFEDFLV